jgi:hypothetical protein
MQASWESNDAPSVCGNGPINGKPLLNNPVEEGFARCADGIFSLSWAGDGIQCTIGVLQYEVEPFASAVAD